MRTVALVCTFLLTACTTVPPSIQTGDGVTLFIRSIGKGSPIVVIHGGPGMDHESLYADLLPLADHHRLVFYDQRGGGRSTLPDPAKLTLDDHVRDLEALRAQLGLEKMTLLAHSFGPAIAARYAIAHPDRVSAMIFLGPIPPKRAGFFEQYAATMNERIPEAQRERMAELVKTLEGTEGDARAACREYWSIATPPRVAEGRSADVVKSDLCTASDEAIRFGMTKTNSATWTSMGDWDWTSELTSLSVPTLVIHGDEDAIPVTMIEGWRAIPNAKIMVLERTGHFPHAEKPAVVFAAIEEFLATHNR